jgi:adenine deaminase
MQEIQEYSRLRAIRAAQHQEPFDLLLRGGRVVDVITGEIRAADVGIVDNLIASVHAPGIAFEAREVQELGGSYLSPGLIDAHVHIESSHMLPEHYAATVLPQGTTTIFYDPHELANVLGMDAIRAMIAATRNLPLRAIAQASSCLPSVPGLEVSGAEFGGAEMDELLNLPEVAVVAEMMDMNGVLSGVGRMAEIAAAARRHSKLLEGHARGLTGERLQGYIAAGVGADHEITSGADFLEKLRAGMTIEIRGSHDYVLPEIVAELSKLGNLPAQVTICTDDVPPDQLLAVGGMIDVLRRLIRYGMKPVDVLRCATLNAASHLGRRDLGAVCAGRIADLVTWKNLETLELVDVYAAGKRVARQGQLIVPIPVGNTQWPCDTVKIAPLVLEDFQIAIPGMNSGVARLRAIKGIRFTEWSEVELAVREGRVVLPTHGNLDADLNFLFTMHRHGRYVAQPQLGIQQGVERMRGAIATTYEHDSHNLFVIGGNAEDMLLAANTLIACGGGMAVAAERKLLAVVELPVAGILSTQSPAEVACAFQAVREAAGKITDWKQPYWRFKALEGMSLACNPCPHLTDLGLTDGKTGEILPLILA